MPNYPYYPGYYNYPNQQQQQQPVGLKGRPVSSIDEVRATSIDFDGSVFYFPDLANKKIYTKQINYDGTSTLNVYEYKPIVNDMTPQYVTRAEFDALVAEIAQKFSSGIASPAGTEVQSASQQGVMRSQAALPQSTSPTTSSTLDF